MQTVCLRYRRGVIGDRVWKIRSKTETWHVVQPLSQRLRAASSPCRKDSLRPEGDVANSDRGRTTIGRAVLVVLYEEGPTERKVPGPAVKGS